MQAAHTSVRQRLRTTLLRWTRSRLRRGRLTTCRVAIAVAAVGVAVLLPAQPAAAHAVLVSSDPVNGSSLSRAPAVVQLRFSEDLMATGSTARLVDAGGTPVPGARVAADSGRHRDLTLRMPTLAAGSYAVVWQVSGASDGHPTGGILVFTVDRAAPRRRGRLAVDRSMPSCAGCGSCCCPDLSEASPWPGLSWPRPRRAIRAGCSPRWPGACAASRSGSAPSPQARQPVS